MKKTHWLSLALVVGLAFEPCAQQLTMASFPQWQSKNVQFGVGGDGPALVIGGATNTRHSEIFYRDFQLNGYQVISVYRPDLMQDQVFYVDKEGNGSHWSLAPTGSINMTGFGGPARDSFNPTGAGHVVEALVYGGINALLNGKATRLFKSKTP